MDVSQPAGQRTNRVCGKSSRKGSIDVVREELMKSAGIQVTNRKFYCLIELMLNASGRLDHIWCAQIRIDAVDRWRHACESIERCWNVIRSTLWRRHYE